MKTKAKLKLLDSGGYWVFFDNRVDICILAAFLTDDVGSDAKRDINELKTGEDYYGTGNITLVDVDGDVAILQDAFSTEEDDPKFVTTRKKLIEILEKWDELYKQKPKEIIITIVGDKITLTGKDD